MNHEEWAEEFKTLLHDGALSGTSRVAALEKLLASTEMIGDEPSNTNNGTFEMTLNFANRMLHFWNKK